MSRPLTMASRSSSGFDGSKFSASDSERVGVDRDALRELGDLGDQLQPQPLRVPEQARVRELADGEVELDLVGRDVEPVAEARDVLRDERGLAVRQQGDADVAAGDDLVRELADDLAELHREQGAADGAHHLAGVLQHRLHLLRRLLGEHAGERVGDAEGDRLGELRPERHGLPSPTRRGR